MATTAEVLALERLHQAAQARLGIAAAFLSLAEWQAVAATSATATATLWLESSLRAITAVSKLSLALAVAYYRLARALETGSTLGVPEGSSTDSILTLGDLRKDFRDLAIDVAALPEPRSRSEDPDIRWFEENLRRHGDQEASLNRSIQLGDAEVDPLIQNLLDVEGSDDSKTITVDEFEWPEEPTLDKIDDAYRDLLREQAIDKVADKVKDLRKDTELTPAQLLDQLEDAHSVAGSIGSGTTEAAGLKAGRDAISGAIREDKKIIAVARGTSGDPCAFCAMLASRGFVYKSEATAKVGGDIAEIEKVHVHCKCFPIVRFIRESELPELNRYFQAKWKEETAGYSGTDALNAFRRWIYRARKANPDDPHGSLNNKTT
jgi:hypothetical protein